MMMDNIPKNGSPGGSRPVASNMPCQVQPGTLRPENAKPGRMPAQLPPVQTELRGLARDMAASPPVDLTKVERLRGQIASGAFRPDPARIADAMLAQEKTTMLAQEKSGKP